MYQVLINKAAYVETFNGIERCRKDVPLTELNIGILKIILTSSFRSIKIAKISNYC